MAAIIIGRIPVDVDSVLLDGDDPSSGNPTPEEAGGEAFAGWATIGPEIEPLPPPLAGLGIAAVKLRAGKKLVAVGAARLVIVSRFTAESGPVRRSWGAAIAAGFAAGAAATSFFLPKLARLGRSAVGRAIGSVRVSRSRRIDERSASPATANAPSGSAVARLDTGQIASRLSAEGRYGRSFLGAVRMVVDPSWGSSHAPPHRATGSEVVWEVDTLFSISP